MRAIVTVTARDRVGIIAEVSTMLAAHQVNILDLNQTILQEFFTMTMLVDTSMSTTPFAELVQTLADSGKRAGLEIRMQREDIFNAMHRI